VTGAGVQASGSTPGGLPYPTTGDRLGQTDAYIGQLADAVAARLASPGVALLLTTVTTDGNGDAWLTFPTLSRCDGTVAQTVTGGGNYAIWPHIIGYQGNAALVRWRKAPIATYSAAMSAYVGALNVCAYGWGAPA
jgi:hypothetical protein